MLASLVHLVILSTAAALPVNDKNDLSIDRNNRRHHCERTEGCCRRGPGFKACVVSAMLTSAAAASQTAPHVLTSNPAPPPMRKLATSDSDSIMDRILPMKEGGGDLDEHRKSLRHRRRLFGADWMEGSMTAFPNQEEDPNGFMMKPPGHMAPISRELHEEVSADVNAYGVRTDKMCSCDCNCCSTPSNEVSMRCQWCGCYQSSCVTQYCCCVADRRLTCCVKSEAQCFSGDPLFSKFRLWS